MPLSDTGDDIVIDRIKAAAAALFIGALCALSPARAADTAKVEQLLTVIKMDQQMAQMLAVMEKSAEQGFVEAARGKGKSEAEIERAKPIFRAAIKQSLDEALSWDYMRPAIARVYQEELTNDEVDAAIAFYGSPQGQSMLAKMPGLMKRGMELGIARMHEVQPKMEAIMEKAFAKLREQEKNDSRASVERAQKQVRENAAKDPGAQKPDAATPQPNANDKAKDADPVKQ